MWRWPMRLQVELAVIVVVNHSNFPVQLKKGVALRNLEPVEQVEWEEGQVAMILLNPEDEQLKLVGGNRMGALMDQLKPDLD